MSGNVLLKVTDLKQHFAIKTAPFKARQHVKAVDGVSLTVNRGETLGLVGESGCGKSTFGRTVLRLYEPTSGKIEFDGQDITKGDMRPYRSRMQIVLQDPYSSLNPRMTVGDIVGEPIDINRAYSSAKERSDKIVEQLNLVGLNTEHMNRYPHEFSGGQRQRISIARALALKPEFIICDEPISALDVSIQAQVINKLVELRESLGLTYLFIAHDLAVVRYISDRIGVMYLGKLVEMAASDELYEHHVHPYTQALLSAVPIADPNASRNTKRIILQGDVPNPLNPPSGCYFRTRCPHATEKCAQVEPQMKQVSPGHFAACHLL